MITPAVVELAKTSARNPTAMQNRRSLRHQPVIRSVATTEVAHPLTMLTAAVATAVRELGSTGGPSGNGGSRSARAVSSREGGRCEILAVAEPVITGCGPVGARRMMRVRGSSADGDGSGVVSLAAGSPGAVNGQPA
ncbi:hypothetical protein MSHO_03570 [Mycobacterium shottsii]|uniref:Uncharacterized protein n=1 Tax=Mycobacterium shottsii TaxID=133549 RepID=A0A7I7L6A5_9MYCO|nr:hypothetical protein MSHO_03570 [Mycobacterium shottsii]